MTVAETFRFHLLDASHANQATMDRAFRKAKNLSRMLLSLGHEVYFYGGAGDKVECTEFIQVPTAVATHYYDAAARAINERKLPDDFLLLMQGVYQKPIADAVGLWLICEPAIDYHGSYGRFRAFESAYLQNFTYGSEHPRQMVDGSPYDRVIPYACDPQDFIFTPKSDDYFLYIGRGSDPDGMDTAAVAAAAVHGRLTYLNLNHAGTEERARLMGYAKAVFISGASLDGDASAAVEAQLCGTPVITTNFGVFPETVVDQVTGFRCNTLQDFVNAARWVGRLDTAEVRRHAERYLMNNVKYDFHQWFCDLYQLYRSAHEPGVKGWHHYE